MLGAIEALGTAIKSAERLAQDRHAALLKVFDKQQGTLDGIGYDLALSRLALEGCVFHLVRLPNGWRPRHRIIEAVGQARI
jgi:hypothetical protein